MNDVASTKLVRVPRPAGLLPVDFGQAMADLATMGFVRIGSVSREDAWIERLTPPAVPAFQGIAMADAAADPKGHGLPDGEAALRQMPHGTERGDVRVGGSDGTAGASSRRPPSQPVHHVEDRMSKEAQKQTEQILRVVKAGADTGAAVARALDLHPYHAAKAIDEMLEEKLLEARGEGRARRIYLRGHAPPAGEGKPATKPRPSPKGRTMGTYTPAAPKLEDLSHAPVASKRFTLRVAGAEVDCASADDVAQLLAALKGVVQ